MPISHLLDLFLMSEQRNTIVTNIKMSNTSTSDICRPQCESNKLSLLSSESASLYYLGITVLASLMTIVTIVLNCTFLATMLCQKRMQKSISHKLMMVLSTIDLLQGISTWPLTAANFVIFYRLDTNCFLLDFIRLLGYRLVALTIWTILLIALEQYLAILHPYFYISHVTFYRLFGPMLLFNMLLIIINIVEKFQPNQIWVKYYNGILVTLGLLIVLALAYMYTKIILCASRVAAKITETNIEEGKQIKSRAKAAKSGLIIFVATLLCYCPFMCYMVYEKLSKPTILIITFARYPAEIFGLFTSVVDPAVYYWRLRSLRKATKGMLSSLCKISNQVGSSWGNTDRSYELDPHGLDIMLLRRINKDKSKSTKLTE